MKIVFRAAGAVLAALLPLPALAVTYAPHGVSNVELQRFVYSPNYPNWCGSAGMAAREMRVKPTTDPSALHGIMKAAIVDCAEGSYAQSHQALWNTAVFGGAAAALLAARNEPPALALRDALHAKNWSADIVKFIYQRRTARASNQPSQYRTDAYRINQDASALVEAILAQNPGLIPAPDDLPKHPRSPV